MVVLVVACLHGKVVVFEVPEHLTAISHSDAAKEERCEFTTFCEEKCVVVGAQKGACLHGFIAEIGMVIALGSCCGCNGDVSVDRRCWRCKPRGGVSCRAIEGPRL